MEGSKNAHKELYMCVLFLTRKKFKNSIQLPKLNYLPLLLADILVTNFDSKFCEV